MASPTSCPWCARRAIPVTGPPSSRLQCRRCQVIATAGGLVVLVLLGVLLFTAPHQGPATNSPPKAAVTALPTLPSRETPAVVPGNQQPPAPQANLPGELPKVTPTLKPQPSQTSRFEPAEAMRVPAPKTVIPLGGGRLLSPVAPGLFFDAGSPPLLQLVRPVGDLFTTYPM